MFQIIPYIQNIACTLICLFIVRIFIVYLRIHKPQKVTRVYKSVKLMIVLGSGGHTFEMLRLIQSISRKFCPRIYVVADTDILSETKAKLFEKSKEQTEEPYVIEKVPRSREVGQSWLTTVFSTVKSFFSCFLLVMHHKPDILLCNGPGTCVPLCLAVFVFHVLGVKHIKIIYVESICRVKTMSLSGKIVYFIADRFLVQWYQLKEKYPRAHYIGKLI